MEDKHKYYPESGWFWKWGWLVVVLVCGLYLMMGCAKEGEPVEVKGSSDDFHVEHLFDVDACKIYRFQDQRLHYFVTCNGSTNTTEEYTTIHSDGKTTHSSTEYRDELIPTRERHAR